MATKTISVSPEFFGGKVKKNQKQEKNIKLETILIFYKKIF